MCNQGTGETGTDARDIAFYNRFGGHDSGSSRNVPADEIDGLARLTRPVTELHFA
jgi:hypothetical protein